MMKYEKTFYGRHLALNTRCSENLIIQAINIGKKNNVYMWIVRCACIAIYTWA